MFLSKTRSTRWSPTGTPTGTAGTPTQTELAQTNKVLVKTQGDLKQTQQDLADTQTERDKAVANALAQSKRADQLSDKLAKTTQERETRKANWRPTRPRD